MDIFSRFKNHYFHYFLGIIVPALVNGLSIPLIKWMIGAAAYGQYALYFNGMLIANLLLSGWLSQSIVRFNAGATDKRLFASQSFFISWLIPAVCFIPVCFIVWHQQGSIFFGLLFSTCLALASLQLPMQTLAQANFRSKAILLAEALRTISSLITSLFLLWLQIPVLYSLFIALCLSYFLSLSFLYKKNFPADVEWNIPMGWKKLMQQSLSYGLPFSLWFVCTYLLTYVDKVLMLEQFGKEVQGNYNALFDFLSRGLVLLLAPILSSVTPLLSEAYEKHDFITIKKLLKKLIGYELLIIVLAVSGYWLIGYKLLFPLLHIPFLPNYKYMGVLIVLGTLIWQVALLVQKPFELKLKSVFLLGRVAIALLCQFAFYTIVKPLHNPLFMPLGYLVAALVYLLLVSISNKKLILEK